MLNFILSSTEVFIEFLWPKIKIGFPENSLILPKKRTKTPFFFEIQVLESRFRIMFKIRNFSKIIWNNLRVSKEIHEIYYLKSLNIGKHIFNRYFNIIHEDHTWKFTYKLICLKIADSQFESHPCIDVSFFL